MIFEKRPVIRAGKDAPPLDGNGKASFTYIADGRI